MSICFDKINFVKNASFAESRQLRFGSAGYFNNCTFNIDVSFTSEESASTPNETEFTFLDGDDVVEYCKCNIDINVIGSGDNATTDGYSGGSVITNIQIYGGLESSTLTVSNDLTGGNGDQGEYNIGLGGDVECVVLTGNGARTQSNSTVTVNSEIVSGLSGDSNSSGYARTNIQLTNGLFSKSSATVTFRNETPTGISSEIDVCEAVFYLPSKSVESEITANGTCISGNGYDGEGNYSSGGDTASRMDIYGGKVVVSSDIDITATVTSGSGGNGGDGTEEGSGGCGGSTSAILNAFTGSRDQGALFVYSKLTLNDNVTCGSVGADGENSPETCDPQATAETNYWENPYTYTVKQITNSGYFETNPTPIGDVVYIDPVDGDDTNGGTSFTDAIKTTQYLWDGYLIADIFINGDAEIVNNKRVKDDESVYLIKGVDNPSLVFVGLPSYNKMTHAQDFTCNGIVGFSSVDGVTCTGTVTDCENVIDTTSNYYVGCSNIDNSTAVYYFNNCTLIDNASFDTPSGYTGYGFYLCSAIQNTACERWLSYCTDILDCDVSNVSAFGGFQYCNSLVGCTSNNNKYGFLGCQDLDTCSATGNSDCGFKSCSGYVDCTESGNGGTDCDEVNP